MKVTTTREDNNRFSQMAYEKLEKLKQYFREKQSMAIAFSGGVDSAFLLKVAHDTLQDRVLAITADSRVFPERETKEAEEFCQKEHCRQIIFSFKELQVPGFSENPPNRCYLCKKELFTAMKKIAEDNQIPYLAEGSNMDDLGDYRPGLLAVKELRVESPLRKVELTKKEIRFLSKELQLPTWDKPSFACLASRFAYGENITEKKLAMVEKGEKLLYQLGFHQFRVRIHGTLARIELLPEEQKRILQPEIQKQLTEKLYSFGFSYVTLDLQGYRTGSMNETLAERKGETGE